MMRGTLAFFLASATLAGLVACGSSPPKSAATPVASSAASAAPIAPIAKVPPMPLPANALRRSAVHSVVAGGLGAFLQRVTLEDEPVFVGNKFHGFRIAALKGDGFWRGVDLKPGDVVTRVNGFPLEHPEEALEAFKSLDVASELRVEYERDGAPKELRYAIVDDVPAKQADARVH